MRSEHISIQMSKVDYEAFMLFLNEQQRLHKLHLTKYRGDEIDVGLIRQILCEYLTGTRQRFQKYTGQIIEVKLRISIVIALTKYKYLAKRNDSMYAFFDKIYDRYEDFVRNQKNKEKT